MDGIRTWGKRAGVWLFALLFAAIAMAGCAAEAPTAAGAAVKAETTETAGKAKTTKAAAAQTTQAQPDERGVYTTKDEVALYLHTYGHLPDNYITKKEAQKLGWESKKGNLDEVAPGKSIGGSHFGNYEGQLPAKKGRDYYECDIDFEGGYRGAKRLIYSDDGMVFYTEDHYNTFEQLY